MNAALIELPYLPPVSYFGLLHRYDVIILEKKEHYIKQTLRNRCFIRTAQRTERLVVPVSTGHGKTPVDEVRIDYRQKWLNGHWRAFQSAYGKAPFFEYYAEDLRSELFRNHAFLYDLNKALLSLCLKWLGWSIRVEETNIYEREPDKAITDLRNRILHKNPESYAGEISAVEYPQVFGSKFVPDLSVLDLVFCAGPQSGTLAKSSAFVAENK